jgi:DNA processing protein
VTQENLYQLALSFIPGIGDQSIKVLISYVGSAEKIFKLSSGKLQKIPGVGVSTAASIVHAQEALRKAEQQLILAEKDGAQLLFYTDEAFPFRLREIPDGPVILFAKGNIPFNAPKTIAIVGTRKATEYGKEQTFQLVQALLPWQPLIVSGLAYGIDIFAHTASLQHQLPTLAVMASGLQYIYPPAHAPVVKKMFSNGGIASEYEYGIKPEIGFFPARNRIVAGLSDAVVVIEAAEKGGALITAELANSYHREVFALPGNINQSHSKGCLHLIRDHKAHILTGVSDIVRIMNWDQKVVKKKTFTLPENASDSERQVLKLLQDQGEQGLDDLSWKTNIALNKLASLLLKLEFEGWLKSLPGKRYKVIEK